MQSSRNSPPTSNGTVSEAPSELDLPDVPDVDNTGTRLVRRVVGLTFSVIGVVLVLGLLVGFFVRIDTTVDAQGTLEPVVKKEIRAPQSGSILEVLVATGDTVRRGQVLAQFDTLQLKGELAQLRSQYQTLRFEQQRAQKATVLDRREQNQSRRQAGSELLRARANLREQLAKYGYDVQASIDSVLTSYSRGTHIAIDRALAQVVSAKANLQTVETEQERVKLSELRQRRRSTELQHLSERIRILERRLERHTVTSPISGVVLTDRPDELDGQFVQEGSLLFEVAKMTEWKVNLFVSEQKASEIQEGDRSKVEVQAFQDETKELIYGVVNSVAMEPRQVRDGASVQTSSTAGADRYRVTVRLDSQQIRQGSRGKLRQGYTVKGKVITDSGRILRLLWDYLFSSSSR